MSYSDLLRPRREVLTDDGVEGIIDLANLQAAASKRKKLEARPVDFLDLTWPTADTRRIVEAIDRRFSGDGDTPGLFLFEGLKGSGKSHLLVLAYHLFMSREPAQAWLSRHRLRCALPDAPVVKVIKSTDVPFYSLWDDVLEALTGKPAAKSPMQAGLAEVMKALGDRSLVLILDELEQGIRCIADPAVRAQNIAFLQMLSELANRDRGVTLFASIYSDHEEPGSTLKRIPSCRIRFEHSADKARVVLHRLFENVQEFDPRKSVPTIQSYLAAWKRHEVVRSEDLERQIIESFPFSPDVLDVLLNRVPARGGFQNIRGALGFLARMVKLTHTRTDLITPAHADLLDGEIATRLGDLDMGGDLIRRARENLKDLAGYPLVREIGSAAMLYTLSGGGRDRGATRDQLLRAACGPSTDINDFEKSLLALQRYGSYFHEREGLYFFDPEENADAKVEFRSLTIDTTGSKAREYISRHWRSDLFKEEPSAVVLVDIDQARQELEALSKGRLRFVLSHRRLSPEERHELYYGLTERNQVILLEPKDATLNALTHRDLIKWAQRALAAEELSPRAGEVVRQQEYERIGREDKKSILDALKRAGLLYVRVEKFGDGADKDKYEEEGLGTAVSREDVVLKISQDIFPVQLIAEEIGNRRDDLRGREISEIERDFKNLLGYPVPTHAASVLKAIRSACKEGQIGIRHPRGNFSGRDPELTDQELSKATIDAPFEAPVRVPRPGEPVLPPPNPPPPQPTPVAAPRPLGKIEEVAIPSQGSIRSLRLQIASRLQALPSAKIASVRFTVFLDGRVGDLSTLPQTLRGSVSGPGSLTAEITITKTDATSKAEVEQLAERLPNIAGAAYSARFGVIVTEDEREAGQGG